MNTKNTKNTTKIVIGMLVILCMFIVSGCNKDDSSTTELSTDTTTTVATSTDIATDTNTTNETTEITTEKEKVESTTEAKVDTESTTTEDKTEVSTAATTTTEVVTTTEQTTQQTPSTTQAPATTNAPTTTQAPTTEAPTTEAPTPKCNHDWVAQTKVVHHNAVGHMETKGTYIDASGNDYGPDVGIYIVNGKECARVGSDWYDQCGVCGIKFYASAYGGSDQAAAQAMADHRWSVHDGCANDIISSDPIYVEVFYKEIAVFVEDKAAYDETITTGYKCSICGATK